ncbi:hypothetical protein [Microvirga subterranea]|uniref:Uncharacterized protein n=1 Tax=Microvirga subterranea TaxID=186651 RepID=A0A370H4Y3_9HYPH|nr:hypothetical protein [Microvirga subterranea]RDI51376.1 hypothetical protein DES45_11832 [Microvirga subterranea]
MKYQPISEVRSASEIRSTLPLPMTRDERIKRWAMLLEANPDRQIQTLSEIETEHGRQRDILRADNSALTVAFEDPVLRSEGLRSDTLADAITFFGLRECDAHYVLCSCLNGQTMAAGAVASKVRGLAGQRASLVATCMIVGALMAFPVAVALL